MHNNVISKINGCNTIIDHLVATWWLVFFVQFRASVYTTNNMSLSNVILLSQIAGYAIALILSLCITVPMSLHQDEFRGHCLLFSSGEWSEGNGQLWVSWASQLYCNYVIFAGVICFLAAAVQMYCMTRLLCKGTDSSFVSAFGDVVASLLLSMTVLIAALMVTLGFLNWCDAMTQRFPSCETAAGKQIDVHDGIETKGFYVEMGTAQFGAWASFACWVGLCVFATLKLLRFHQMHNLRASMYRERQRLIVEAAAASTATHQVEEGALSCVVGKAAEGELGTSGPIVEVQ